MSKNMQKSAVFSECRKYRYSLKRIWDDQKPYVLFIGLNPSTADEESDDDTLTRCIDYAMRWGFGGVAMGNLFAFKETDRHAMLRQELPVGDENDQWLQKLAADAGMVVAAWGNDGANMGRSSQVSALIPNLHCLKVNATGEPSHPLYQKKILEPIPYLRKPA